jgi:hypothetical protein
MPGEAKAVGGQVKPPMMEKTDAMTTLFDIQIWCGVRRA